MMGPFKLSAFAVQAADQCRFWSEPATEDQKRIILQFMQELGMVRMLNGFTVAKIDDPALWPTPFRVWPGEFTRWDAYRLIRKLEERLGKSK